MYNFANTMEMFENLTYKQTLLQRAIGAVLIMGALLCIFQPEYHSLRVFTRFAPQITMGYWLLGLGFLAIKQARLTMLSFICCWISGGEVFFISSNTCAAMLSVIYGSLGPL